ncbi:MAG: hypothetical protein WDN30_09170 [Pararobbsia sp.]
MQGLRIHLDAMNVAEDLANGGDVHADTLALWADKMAQATQVQAFGAQANWPRADDVPRRGTRIARATLIDGVDANVALVAELQATRTALSRLRRMKADLDRPIGARLLARWRGARR